MTCTKSFSSSMPRTVLKSENLLLSSPTWINPLFVGVYLKTLGLSCLPIQTVPMHAADVMPCEETRSGVVNCSSNCSSPHSHRLRPAMAMQHASKKIFFVYYPFSWKEIPNLILIPSCTYYSRVVQVPKFRPLPRWSFYQNLFP